MLLRSSSIEVYKFKGLLVLVRSLSMEVYHGLYSESLKLKGLLICLAPYLRVLDELGNPF